MRYDINNESVCLTVDRIVVWRLVSIIIWDHFGKLLTSFSQIVPYIAKQIEMRKKFSLRKKIFYFKRQKQTPDIKLSTTTNTTTKTTNLSIIKLSS